MLSLINALGRPAAAAYLQESLRVAQAQNSVRQICISYFNLGLTRSFQNRHAEAIAQAQRALGLAQGRCEGIARTELLALASLKLRPSYLQAGDFTKAIEEFDRAIELYTGINTQEAFGYSAHKSRRLALLERDGPAALEEAIAQALKLFEQHRIKICEERNRHIFFNVEQSSYDIAIDFWHTQKRDTFTACALAERCHARSLLDLVRTAPRTLPEATYPDLAAERLAPLIAKGIPLVVASLWAVDSAATGVLMARFHEYRKQRALPTAEALRQAQLSLLRDSDTLYQHPYYWASFASIGGYAKF